MEETKDINETVAEEKATEKKKKCNKSAELDALKAEVEALKAESAAKDDKYLRLAAEYDNFRRRSREEKDATYSSAMADTVSELLPIIDNLERAAAFDDGEKVKEGLKMILSTVESSLGKLGVETFGKEGAFTAERYAAVVFVAPPTVSTLPTLSESLPTKFGAKL